METISRVWRSLKRGGKQPGVLEARTNATQVLWNPRNCEYLGWKEKTILLQQYDLVLLYEVKGLNVIKFRFVK